MTESRSRERTQRRLLFVSHTAPAPPVSGERQRALNLLRQLGERGWEVSLFCIEHGSIESDALEELRELAPGGLLVQPQPHPAWRFARSRLDVLRGRPFQRSFFLNRRARREFHSWLEGREFDVVMVALIFMLTYLPRELASRTVLDSQNAEFHRLQSMESARSGHGRALAARWQLRAVERLEREASMGVRAHHGRVPERGRLLRAVRSRGASTSFPMASTRADSPSTRACPRSHRCSSSEASTTAPTSTPSGF